MEAVVLKAETTRAPGVPVAYQSKPWSLSSSLVV